LTKTGAARHLSHREFMLAILRALRRAAWPLCYSEGFHPKPKVSFGPACPVGVASLTEWMDVSLQGSIHLPELLERLAAQLGDGVGLLDGQIIEASAAGIMPSLRKLRYRIDLPASVDLVAAEQACQDLLEAESWTLARQVKGRQKTVDLRPSLLGLGLETGPDGPRAWLELDPNAAATARPAEVIRALFGPDAIALILLQEACLCAPSWPPAHAELREEERP
jgi:radical SAM-linked protein